MREGGLTRTFATGMKQKDTSLEIWKLQGKKTAVHRQVNHGFFLTLFFC